ncbi:hypothetical protein ACFZDJ_51380 [Streptomyces sp. NPDC007896]|uniref:hypothetical protein n=1 Tax=Streptomyces sp. NPDC007896 TaxID=3364784 RepID=UPI0036E13E19
MCIASLPTTTGQVGHGVQQRLEAGDLAGLLANAQLGKDQAGGVLQCGKQTDLVALRFVRTPQALAVNRQAAQPDGPSCLRPTVREPPSNRSVQRVAVDTGQQPADGCPGEQDPPGRERIGTDADLLEHIRRGVGEPLVDPQ